MSESTNELTPLQISEITKAFSICDTDGNGEIDAVELAAVMQHIMGTEPSAEDVERLLIAVDKDQSGTVSLAEFLEAMSEWLSEGGSSNVKRFKTSSVIDDRKEVHHQIKGFFSQFQKAQDYEDVRSKIASDDDCYQMETGFGWSQSGSGEHLNSQQKLEFLVQFHQTIPNLNSLINSISFSGIDRINALSSLVKLLSITEVFAKPSERSAVADDLAQLFESLVRFNLPELMVNVLQNSTDSLSQTYALKCLTYFAPGPRVPSTPPTSLMHPKQLFFKRMIIACDAPNICARFLNLNLPSVCEQAVLFIVAMVSHDAEVRDYYLENQILSLLCPLVLDSTPTTILTPVARALAALCGVTHSAASLPAWEYIQPCFTPLGQLLFSEDEKCLLSVLAAMVLILPGIRSDFSVINRILELTANATPQVAQYALNVINQVVKFDVLQTMSFLARGLIEALKISFASPESIVRSSACDVLIALVARNQYQPLINSGIIDILFQLMPHDEHLRPKLVSLVVDLSASTPPLVQYMAQLGFVPLLCNCLSWFKEYDRVLLDAYLHTGPLFNFDLIAQIFTALENILLVGEMERFDTGSNVNSNCLLFDLECIDRIRSVLLVLFEGSKDGLVTWRTAKEGDEPLEQRLYNILNRIKTAYEGMNMGMVNLARDRVTTMISKIFDEFFPTQDVQMEKHLEMVSSTLIIKCYLPDDIRVFEVNRDVSYSQLMELIVAKYGRSFKVSFKDAEGDSVSFDEASMPSAFAQAEASNNPTVKLYLTENQPKPTEQRPATPPSEDEDIVSENVEMKESKKRSRDGSVLPVKSTNVLAAFSGNVKLAGSYQDVNTTNSADLMREEFAAMKLVQRNQNFAELQSQTHFGEAELETLYNQWTKDSPNGEVGREQFEKGMKEIGITDPLVIAQNFNAFDVDKDGLIDFREFVVSLSTILRGSNDERLKFMFRSYDTDNSGNLSPDEIVNIFKASMAINGTLATESEIRATVLKCFQEIDTDGNGEISFEEFKAAVESNKLPVVLAFAPMAS